MKGIIKLTNRLKRIPAFWRWTAPVLVVASIVWMSLPDDVSTLPAFTVKSGEFVVDLKEPGKLRAENSVLVTSPPARVNLQIIDLVPEGAQVHAGDFLIQFDTTELRQQLDDQIAERDIARATLTKSQASMASHMASLQSSLENSRASYRLSELRLEQMKFEADVRVEEGRLSLKQAEISLKQAEAEIAAQMQIDSADVRSLELKLKQAEFDITKTRGDLDRLRMTAPSPGLVVYKETWRGGEMSKIKIGDTPWRGAALIEIPDLSIMQVATAVSEVDFSMVKVGQEATIKLDAYPDPVFKGEVIEVAALARGAEGESRARMFDVVVRILGSDPLLRPGMSATANIIVSRTPEKLSVPIEAVFDRGGRMAVFAANGRGFDERLVKLGDRNDNFVVIEEGLREGERVALVDPTVERSEATTKRDKSASPSAPQSDETPAATKPRMRDGRLRRGG